MYTPTQSALTTQRLAMVRRLARLAALLMLATIVLSAFMRLSQAGLGCADWPACYGQLSGAAAASGADAAVAAARLLHRLVASVVLILCITLALATWATRPRLPREGRLAALLLALALGLAALGVVTSGATLPAVTVGNLVGGFLMLALCGRLAQAPGRAGLGTWAWLAAALLLLQAALGALLSGAYAALSCQGLGDCLRTAAATGWDWRALNPWQQPALQAGPPFNPAGALVQLVHRGNAMLVLAVMATLATAAWRRGWRGQALALVLLVLLQVALGAAAVAFGLPMALVLLHNLGAALLLALVVRLG